MSYSSINRSNYWYQYDKCFANTVIIMEQVASNWFQTAAQLAYWLILLKMCQILKLQLQSNIMEPTLTFDKWQSNRINYPYIDIIWLSLIRHQINSESVCDLLLFDEDLNWIKEWEKQNFSLKAV